MPERTPNCPKCGDKKMEIGFLPDATFGGYFPTKWFAGVPVISRWSGIQNVKAGLPGGLQVATYRCPNCGYLELYAPTPV